MMDIRKYTGYFHDGSIEDIKSYDKNIELWMSSSEILPEWHVDLPLSNTSRITGKLILRGVEKINISDLLVSEISFIYDSGEILQFEIYNNKVTLLMIWYNFPPKDRMSKFEQIIIHASQIEWENIPDLLDLL